MRKGARGGGALRSRDPEAPAARGGCGPGARAGVGGARRRRGRRGRPWGGKRLLPPTSGSGWRRRRRSASQVAGVAGVTPRSSGSRRGPRLPASEAVGGSGARRSARKRMRVRGRGTLGAAGAGGLREGGLGLAARRRRRVSGWGPRGARRPIVSQLVVSEVGGPGVERPREARPWPLCVPCGGRRTPPVLSVRCPRPPSRVRLRRAPGQPPRPRGGAARARPPVRDHVQTSRPHSRLRGWTEAFGSLFAAPQCRWDAAARRPVLGCESGSSVRSLRWAPGSESPASSAEGSAGVGGRPRKEGDASLVRPRWGRFRPPGNRSAGRGLLLGGLSGPGSDARAAACRAAGPAETRCREV